VKAIRLRRVGRLRGQPWEQIELPRYARSGLLVNLCNTAPLAHPFQVVTIHDAAAWDMPASFSWSFRTWYRTLQPLLVRRAARAITVSSFSRKRVARYCRVPEGRFRIVREGGDHMRRIEPDVTVLRRAGVAAGTFLLAVGSLNPSKNVEAVLEAVRMVQHLPLRLVVAGAANPAIFADRSSVSGSGMTGAGASYLGYVTDAELRALYQAALCLVFPSLYEGFGLPPLEAMTLGCPVIASRAGAIPEVCGDAALYCDGGSPGSIASAVQELMGSPVLRDALIQRGRTRAAQFTWERAARALLRVVDECERDVPLRRR
jgi:glycosyltransferase involved in cell wall biosynthesis